jgi:hypothetical protein
MKKFILFILCAGFFMTASAQARVSVGFRFGTPMYGYRPMYYAPPPVMVPAGRIYARPHHRRVVVVARPRPHCYNRKW